MADQVYKVVIKGVAAGRDPEEVTRKLASVFKISPEKAARFIQGKPVLVKKDLDRTSAAKYRKVIEQAGAVCAVMGPPAAGPAVPDAPSPPPARGPTSENRMTCPKCGFEQDQAETCNKCGLILEKYYQARARRTTSTPTKARYYRHSGSFGFIGLILMLTFGAFTAVIGGMIYGQAIYYIPWVYLNFIITFLFGFIVGYSVGFGGKLGHVRNSGVLLLLGLLFGLLAEYVGWVSWIYALSEYEVLVLGLPDLWTLIKKIGAQGPWSIFGWTPKGGQLYLCWLIELVIIVGTSTIAALIMVGVTPYCENCRKWIEAKKSIFPLDVRLDPEEMRERLEAGDFSPLLSLNKMQIISNVFTQVDLLHCPSCRQVHLLSVILVEVTVDSEGKEDRSEAFVVENLIIDRAAFEEIKDRWK